MRASFASVLSFLNWRQKSTRDSFTANLRSSTTTASVRTLNRLFATVLTELKRTSNVLSVVCSEHPVRTSPSHFLQSPTSRQYMDRKGPSKRHCASMQTSLWRFVARALHPLQSVCFSIAYIQAFSYVLWCNAVDNAPMIRFVHHVRNRQVEHGVWNLFDGAFVTKCCVNKTVPVAWI